MDRQQNAYQYPRIHPSSYQQPKLQIDTHDNRFSFMPAQVEPERNYYPQNAPGYAIIPPLPKLPYNMNSTGETQQRTASATQEMTQPKTQEVPVNPDVQSDYQMRSQQSERIPDTKKDTPHRPDPIKITTHTHRSRMSIGPDENPLSPSTASYTPIWTPKTTNMNIPVSNYTPATPAPQAQAQAQATHGGSWTHSLCSCAEPTICTTSLFCPCIVYGRTQYRLSLRSERKDPTNMLGYSSVNGSCVMWSLLCGVNGILSGLQRGRVRRAYEMNSGSGNLFADCLVGCCCCCCVVAQSEKEVKVREEAGRRLGGCGPMGKQEGYIPPGGMVFQPPPQHQHR